MREHERAMREHERAMREQRHPHRGAVVVISPGQAEANVLNKLERIERKLERLRHKLDKVRRRADGDVQIDVEVR